MKLLFHTILGLLFLLGESSLALNEMLITNVRGRRVNEQGLIALDWEGELANPLVLFSVAAPSDATFPATLSITATNPRGYFDNFRLDAADTSTAGAGGPQKTLRYTTAGALQAGFALFPDRDNLDEEHLLTLSFTSGNGQQRVQQLLVRLQDQDSTASPDHYPIVIDFSEDQTGFYNLGERQTVFTQAAQDWAYFFTNMGTDVVPVGQQLTFIWNPSGFITGQWRPNAQAYQGFLLYTYGINSATMPYRSGGAPSNQGFQSIGGSPTQLRSSGAVEMEIKGNYNTLGWTASIDPATWWQATNLGNVTNDLYSIAHHEIGHALYSNSFYPIFQGFEAAGQVTNTAVVAYHGSPITISPTDDHFPTVVDRLSQRGAFGNEYNGSFPRVPWGRWLITKLDLLVASAVGYPLRDTSAFRPLSFSAPNLGRGSLGREYRVPLLATGGLPAYEWVVETGALPPGLSLNSFTGLLSGVPISVGTYPFTLRLRDSDLTTAAVSRALTLRVGALPLEPDLQVLAGQSCKLP